MEWYKLTLLEKVDIKGKAFAPGSTFNPREDENNVWFISPEEVRDTVFTEYLWVKDLTPEEFVPKEEEI